MRNLAIGALVLLSGCSIRLSLPESYDHGDPPGQPGSYTRAQLMGPGESNDPFTVPRDVEASVSTTLADAFGTPANPGMLATYSSGEEYDAVYRGSQLYQKHCIHCHGLNGGGNGPTAAFLNPRPRDYRRGIFKWKSTVPNAKPTRDDLLRVLHEGALGSSMPPFRLLPPDDLEDLATYVIFLSKRGETQRWILQQYASNDELPSKEELADRLVQTNQLWANAVEQITIPAASMPTLDLASHEYEESLQRGRTLFLGAKAACYKCHANDGRADPAKIDKEELKKMVDDWGYPNYPRNLTLGLYRGGRRPVDLYRRIHDGIKGAAMPEGGKNLSTAEIWDLVQLVRALPYRPGLLPDQIPAADASSSHGGH